MATKEVNEKVKPIILHDTEEEEDYTLEFNRETVRFAEGRGFDIPDDQASGTVLLRIQDAPQECVP